VVDPRRRAEPVPDAKADLAAHAPSPPIAFVVREVVGIFRPVRVVAHGDDPRIVHRDRPEAPEEPPGPARILYQPEVVPEHDNRVEAPE
jgi:hypothetical protein